MIKAMSVKPDRSRVAANQDYDSSILAQKYGLSHDQARELIARAGNKREKLEEAARKLRFIKIRRAAAAARVERGKNSRPGRSVTAYEELLA